MGGAGTRAGLGAEPLIKHLMSAGVEGNCFVVPAGEMLLRMPEHLIITLEGVFEDEVSSLPLKHTMLHLSFGMLPG